MTPARRNPNASNEAERSLTLVRMPPFLLGLPTESLGSIREGEREESTLPSLDLARLLGTEPAAPDRRRSVRLEGENACEVVTHGDLRVEPVRLQDIHPLPRYLEGLRTALGVESVVARGQAYGLLLDATSLKRRASEESGA